jgi:excisionase family DNA binding protein
MISKKRIVTRAEAERSITESQLELLREYDCLSTWEMYADYGVGPCCGGIFRLRTAELVETYRHHIPNADKMTRDDLLKEVLRFERSQLGGRPITCNAVAAEGRVCDGLDRYTNQELPWRFPDILRDCVVVDDEMTLPEAAAYLGVSRTRLLELVYEGRIATNEGGPKKFDKSALDEYSRAVSPAIQ